MKLGSFGTCVALGAALILSACGSDPQPTETGATKELPKPKPQSEIDPEAYKANPATAMKEVSKDQRETMRKITTCYVKRKKAEGGVVTLDSEIIRKFNAAIKAGASVEVACQL